MNKRLSIDIPKELHDTLKHIAIKYNVSLSKYVIRVLIERILEEQELEKK